MDIKQLFIELIVIDIESHAPCSISNPYRTAENTLDGIRNYRHITLKLVNQVKLQIDSEGDQ